MDILGFVQSVEFLWSPPAFGVLVGLAAALVWLAIVPSQALRTITGRLDEYVEARDVVEELEMDEPFGRRAVAPFFRRVLAALGRMVPLANVEQTRRRLIQAGEPGGLTALDFLGLRVLLPGALGGGYFLLWSGRLPFNLALRNALLTAAVGFFLPAFWLSRRVSQRKKEITRALPDALDMLTIGVEAGLAFESALLRVAEQWQNALTEEFRRAVREMRLGAAREEALERMVDRTGAEPLATFVAVLVQSSRLGVSISQVLHSQADQMRIKRRQLAEEQARQASVKMVFPLVFLIFPAIFVIVLGPSVPSFLEFFANIGGGVELP